jgi:GNAT superfamily N-acetyltransferase
MPSRDTVPEIRPAVEDDLVAVMRLLDAAVLEADASVVSNRIDDEAVLVALADGRIVGTLVLDDAHVDAIAVQQERRGRGIGSALVDTAAGRVDGPLTVDFDERVRPFYDALGFGIEPRNDRYWGSRDSR